MTKQLDLFGAPIATASRPAGRPRHAPTARTRRIARALSRRGATHDQIAAAIGITAPTLRMHYHEELGSSSQVWKRRLPATADASADPIRRT